MIDEITMALLPVFFALVLGYGAGKRQVIDNKNVSSLNDLVMQFAIPAELFASISAKNRSDITSHSGFIAVTAVGMLVMYAVTLALQLKAFRLDMASAAEQAITVSFPNYASIGLPLAAVVVGSQGAIAVAIAVTIGAVTITPLTLALLGEEQDSPDAPGSTVSRFGSALGTSVRKPIFWAPLLALVLVLSGVRMPALIEAALTPIGTAGAGAALFLTGLILSAHPVSFDRNVGYSIVAKNALMPLFTWGLCVLFGLNTLSTTEAVLLAAIPSGFFGLIFGANFGVLREATGSTVMLSTVGGIVSLSAVIAVLPHM